MQQYFPVILSNFQLCPSMYQLDFLIEERVETPLPGQFFTARISDSVQPLLRRPFAFSAFDQSTGSGSSIYQVRGRGTELMSRFCTSMKLDIIAPLGKPFPLPGEGENPVLIAGGIGLGPLWFFAQVLEKSGRDYVFIFGSRSKSLIPPMLLSHPKIMLCTDDGSYGFHGTVIGCLEESFDRSAATVIYCCGPEPMLRGCHNFSVDHGIICYVSVEQVMACGVGACMGCAVKARGGEFVRACTEGPVFNSRDLQWD